MAHSAHTAETMAPVRNFTFKSGTKVALIVGIVVGIICLALTYLFDHEGQHSRFWSNVLHNSAFFTGIAMLAGFFMSASITAWAGWYTTFKRVWESMSLFLIVGLVLMTILGVSVYMGWNNLYHWNDAHSVETDTILNGKSGFLNKGWYLFATIIFVSAWYFIMTRIRSLSLREENEGNNSEFNIHAKIRVWAAAYLPIAGFTMCALVWLWIMSVDAHWYSTLYAWYTGASWFVAMISLTLMIIVYLRKQGYYSTVSSEHIHDIGKLVFAFSIFWTYLWFSQFMLIWYANVGEETGYFKHRMDNYPILFYGNLVINFVLPFFILMRNSTKRKLGSVGLVAILVFVGHWLDFFLMIKPGVLHTAHELAHGEGHHGATDAAHGHGAEAAHHGAEAVGHAAEHVSHFVSGFTLPGLLEFGTFIGFLCMFLFFFFSSLSRASLQSENDPYYQESLIHHV